jgi:hypothetical protein
MNVQVATVRLALKFIRFCSNMKKDVVNEDEELTVSCEVFQRTLTGLHLAMKLS